MEESHAPTHEEMEDLLRAEDPQPDCYTLRIPVINSKCTAAEMKSKIFEELDELLKEIVQRGEVINTQAALSEMFDVCQAIIGYIHAKMTEQNVLYPNNVVSAYLNEANYQHIEKIKLYAIERGWEVYRS